MLKNLDEHSYAGKLTGEINSSQGPDKNMSSVGLYFKRIITQPDKRFKLKKHVREHRIEQDQQKRHFCSKCEEVFTSLEKAVKHRMIHHRVINYRCNLCNRRFYSTETLNRHVTLHVVEKPFKCTKCAKAYRCRKKWILHQKLHFQDSTFKCNACKKTFVSHWDFNKHLQGHMEGDRACHACSEKFSDKKSLRVHLFTHSGKSSFSCDTCGKTYLHQHSLTKHSKVHTKAECQFHCDICRKDFKSGTVFKQHIEQVHSAKNELLTHGGVSLAHGLEGSKAAPVPTCLLFKLPISSESSCTALTALPEHSPMEGEGLPVPGSLPSKLPTSLESYPALMELIPLVNDALPVPSTDLFNLPSPSDLSSAIVIVPAFYD
ncbi:hypothetical protein Btru_057875 [Bulinus truncatus]|nr:hypothetical protein Btru_057875 [Bulinus truncatus]